MLGRCEAQVQVGIYSACRSFWVAEVKESCLLGLDFLCEERLLLDFSRQFLMFPDGTRVPFLSDSPGSDMKDDVAVDSPQWEPPYADCPLPLPADSLLVPDPGVRTQSHSPAAIRAASVAPSLRKGGGSEHNCQGHLGEESGGIGLRPARSAHESPV